MYECMCVGVSVFTCVGSSTAVCVCCPVLVAVLVVMLWLLLQWMDSRDTAEPSTPNPTRDKNTNEVRVTGRERFC